VISAGFTDPRSSGERTNFRGLTWHAVVDVVLHQVQMCFEASAVATLCVSVARKGLQCGREGKCEGGEEKRKGHQNLSIVLQYSDLSAGRVVITYPEDSEKAK